MTHNLEHAFSGFQQELEKSSADIKTGIEGVALGAALGAAMSGLGAYTLEKIIRKNRNLAIIAGAIMGASTLGSAGFLLGKGSSPAPKSPVSNSLEGTPISELRVRR
jgi:hypothetical protein